MTTMNVRTLSSGLVHYSKRAYSMWGKPIVIGRCGAGARARFAPVATSDPVTCARCAAKPATKGGAQ